MNSDPLVEALAAERENHIGAWGINQCSCGVPLGPDSRPYDWTVRDAYNAHLLRHLAAVARQFLADEIEKAEAHARYETAADLGRRFAMRNAADIVRGDSNA